MRPYFTICAGALAVTLTVGTGVFCQPGSVSSQASLLQTLRSSASLEAKCAACRQLARVGTVEAIPTLAGLLADEKLAHMARYALEQIPGEAVQEALRAAVPKLQGKLLVGVLLSLGTRRDGKAVPMLASFLHTRDIEVASAAAHALGAIGTVEAGKALVATPDHSPSVPRSVRYDAVLACATALAAQGQRDQALAMFERLRGSSAPAAVRAAAARGAVLARQPAGVEPLRALLHEKEDELFKAALRLAVEIPGPNVSAMLAAEVAKLTDARAALVITALATRGAQGALPAIRTASKRNEAAVRLAALDALAKLGDVPSLPLMLEAAGSADKKAVAAAAAALVRLPGNEVDTALLAWLRGTDINRCLLAMDCLARRQTAGAAVGLLEAAGKREPQVRLAALKVLGDVAAPSDLPAIVALLVKAESSAEKKVVEQALASVCALAPDRQACAEKLLPLLGQASPEPKMVLLRALALTGGTRALQAERDAARDAHAGVKAAALEALCNWPDREAAGDMLKLAQDSLTPKYKVAAVRGYLRLADDVDLPAQERLTMFKQVLPLIERVDEYRLLVGALQRVNAPDALTLILPYLDRAGVKEEACVAAVKVADKLTQQLETLRPQDASLIIKVMEKVRQTSRNAPSRENAQKMQERARLKALTR